MTKDRSVSIGGNALGNIIVTGSNNVLANGAGASATVTQTSASNIDIVAVLAALRPLLAGVDSPDAPKIDSALKDAKHELSKADPSRDEVGGALERALKYARTGKKFVETAAQIAPLVSSAAGWLGEQWDKLSDVVGNG